MEQKIKGGTIVGLVAEKAQDKPEDLKTEAKPKKGKKQN